VRGAAPFPEQAATDADHYRRSWERSAEGLILQEVARHVGSGKLVISTVASSEPDGLFDEYAEAFRKLGVHGVEDLRVSTRGEAKKKEVVSVLDDATAVFFTGGDQLKITSQIGDTPVFQRIRAIYSRGGLVAGTSAGASAVSTTMLVSGSSRTSPRVGDAVQMAPGLGFIHDVIIDQHFAERGRLGRLLGAVAQNPKTLGLGIDEDTAVVVDNGESFYVVGSGAVYVADGSGIDFSNITEPDSDKTLALHGLTLHALSQGDSFDLKNRRPISRGATSYIQTLGAVAGAAGVA
jgi:cyanophycinase